MKIVANLFFKLILLGEFVVRLGFFGLSLGLILLVAYFLGFGYLRELVGNDAMNALNNVYWLACWWPKIPFWYPGQGGGVSLVWGYPILSSLMVIGLSLWQKINLAAAFKVLGFFSLPLTAAGMYLFVWRRLKNQAAALIAAVFYLLMPIAWVWLFDWGFYAEQIAYIFIFPALVFFDRFLAGFTARKIDGTTRLSLLLSIFFLGLTFAAHPNMFFAVIRIAGIYSPIYFFSQRKKFNLKELILAFLPVFLVFVLTVLALAFLTANYQYYAKFSRFNTEPAPFNREEFAYYYSVPVDSLLGLGKIPADDAKYTHRNIVVPPLVWLPAILGGALSVFFSGKVLGLALAAGLSFLFLYKPALLATVVSLNLPLVSYFYGMRAEVFILKILSPIVAAFGLWALPGLLLKILTFWLRFKSQFGRWALGLSKGVIAGGVSLGLAGFLIFHLANQPAYLWQKTEVRYGPYFFDIRDPFVKPELLPPPGPEEKIDLWQKTGWALLDKDFWPRPDLKEEFKFPFEGLANFNRKHGQDQFLRIDVSPFLGGVVQSLNMVNQASLINLYAVQLNLLGPYWGYQQQVMFSENDNRIGTVNELAKWYGTQFLLLSQGLDPLEKYRASHDWQVQDEHELVWQYQERLRLWTLTSGKPTILVIGDLKRRAFEPVFRAANKGALPYDDFWLVQGEEAVDHYSPAELAQFDILLLYGYHYKNKNKAYRLLDNFVKNGGGLFISSGWQFVDQDWEIEKAPPFFPAESLAWTEKFSKESHYQLDSSLIGPVDLDLFGPLVWSEKSWGVSAPAGLRPWAKPILSVEGQPLVIGGEYGKGRVVLAGLNLIGHLHSYDYNQSEKNFFWSVFRWLKPPAVKDWSETVTARRDFPDRLEFVFHQPAEKPVFYFRESFFPSWQARLVKSRAAGEAFGDARQKSKVKSLDIYRAGPGFKLLLLPTLEAGDQLILEFKPGVRHWFWVLVSAITFLGLAIWAVLGRGFYRPIWAFLSKRLRGIEKKAKRSWEEEG